MAQPSFDSVIEAHWDAVHRVVRRLVSTNHDADEVTQETFFLAFRAWSRFEGRSSPRTWLIRIAMREAMRHTKADALRPGALSGEGVAADTASAAAERAETRATLDQALAGLAPVHRLVLTLFFVEGMPHREIAAVLECPEGTVWSRLHHARNALQAALSHTDLGARS